VRGNARGPHQGEPPGPRQGATGTAPGARAQERRSGPRAGKRGKGRERERDLAITVTGSPRARGGRERGGREGVVVTPEFKGQSRVHLIHAPKKTTYIITECIEINVTITSEYLLHCGSLTK
jgi:hypothetical protein